MTQKKKKELSSYAIIKERIIKTLKDPGHQLQEPEGDERWTWEFEGVTIYLGKGSIRVNVELPNGIKKHLFKGLQYVDDRLLAAIYNRIQTNALRPAEFRPDELLPEDRFAF